MLNGNKENEYRHRPEYIEFVVLFNINRSIVNFTVFNRVCYHLILYYRLTVSKIYVYCKNFEIFLHHTNINYRTVKTDIRIIECLN